MPSSVKDYRELIDKPWGRMFYDMIYNQLDLRDNKRIHILDFGAGFCVTANHYAKNHNVTAVEPSKEMLSIRLKENDFTLLNGGIELLKDMPDNSFDLIICHNVLEYVPDKKIIIKELTRVLKPNGKLSIVKHNLTGRIFAYAVFGDNPKSALELMNKNDDNESNMFGNRDTYRNEDLIQYCTCLGLKVDSIYGIRTFFALSSNDDIKYTDEWYKNMLELEMQTCNIEKYKDIAFFNHLVFTKEGGRNSYGRKVQPLRSSQTNS